MHWVKDDDEDAEYNQWFTMFNDEEFLIYSDRDGEMWTFQDPSGHSQQLDANNIEDAINEARNLVLDYTVE